MQRGIASQHKLAHEIPLSSLAEALATSHRRRFAAGPHGRASRGLFIINNDFASNDLKLLWASISAMSRTGIGVNAASPRWPYSIASLTMKFDRHIFNTPSSRQASIRISCPVLGLHSGGCEDAMVSSAKVVA